jgi:uncharacterized membrane protein YbhN (UPF0104 family)
MTEAALPDEPTSPRHFDVRRIVVIAVVVAAVGAVSHLLGWDVRAWFEQLWDTITGISAGYLVAGVVLETLQTTATAFAWCSILRYAYPGGVRFRTVLACYAASVALNFVVPANLGTLAMLLMFVAVIPGATFPGVLAGYLVEKIFFTIAGAAVYLYLFLSVAGSFDIKFSWVHEHPWATAAGALGAVGLIAMLVRNFRAHLRSLWEKAKHGGEVLLHPGAFLLRVVLPEFIGWCAMLGMIGVFLAAYSIPVSFDTIMRVVGGNSIANVTSVTPGGVGVNQAFNVASLRGVTTSSNATAYSLGQQIVTTAWSVTFAIVLLVWVFGWSGGKQLVGESYAGAKAKASEQRAARKSKRATRRGRG